MSDQTVIDKILAWRGDQLKRGLDPREIALSPWDIEALENSNLGCFSRRFAGLDIISTPDPAARHRHHFYIQCSCGEKKEID